MALNKLLAVLTAALAVSSTISTLEIETNAVPAPLSTIEEALSTGAYIITLSITDAEDK